MPDHSGKTEEPTQRKLQKARKEGQFAAAKEFVGALQFMVFLGLLSAGGAAWFTGFRQTTRGLLAGAFTGEVDVTTLTRTAWILFWRQGMPLIGCGMAVTVTTVSFRLATTRFGFSWKKLMPDLKRFNPLSKLRELPRQNLPQVIQALVLLPVFLWAVYTLARDKV